MASTINASTSSGIVQTADTSGVLQLQTAGTTAVTVDASQNVGIGTTSPANFLDISKTQDAETNIGLSNTSTGANAQVRTKYTTNSGLFTVGTTGTAHPYGGDAYIYQVANKGIRFATNDTERMRIDSSGRPLFNTTSALNAGYMSLLFDGSAYNGFTLKTSYATLGSVYLYFINSAGNVAGYVTQNGTTTVNYVTSSDYRMKENVVPITNALDRVAKLKPVTYTWKDTNNEQGEGFIAHELQEVCPLAVSGEKDAVNEDGTIKPQGIDTSKLVATLTAAIQEQQTIINDLKARITALEGVK